MALINIFFLLAALSLQMVALGDQLSSRDALRTYELHRRDLHVRDNANDESTEVDDDDVDDDDSGIITDIEGRQRTPEEQKAVDAWGWAKAETWAKPAVEWKNLVCGPGPSKWEPVHIGMTSNKKSRVGRFRNSESWLLINDLRRNNTKKTGSTVTTIGAETCQHFACGLGEAAIGVCNDNKKPYTFKDMMPIVSGAAEILRDCAYPGQGKTSNYQWEAVGQKFSHDGWNVILRGLGSNDTEDDCTHRLHQARPKG